MPVYNVHIFCSQCGRPHSVNIKLTLDAGLDKTLLSDYYADVPLPSQIVFMQTNRYNCPHTKQLYSADDLEKAVLFENRA